MFIADDHALFRQGISEMLSTAKDIFVVGEAGTFERTVASVSKLRPDVVLLDLEMPGLGAEEAIRRMLEVSSPPRIVVLTMHDEARLARKFIALGAASYLTKSVSLEDLVSAVREAARMPLGGESGGGVRTVPEEVIENMHREADGLSERELEILLQAARGMSNRQAANSLHLSEATIKRHLANVYKKLGVGSRSEATRIALSNNWISSYEISDDDEKEKKEKKEKKRGGWREGR